MVNAKHPFEILRDSNVRKKFDQELLTLMKSWDYSVISVCLDKKRHKETYTTWRYDPYHYCLHVLMERFVFFLNNKKSKGDVMAESRGGKEDKRLKDSFAFLWEKGTDYVRPERFQEALTSKQLKVKPKANNISGLQLADLLAHPSRNEILREENLLSGKIAPFAERIIEVLRGKYYRRENKMFGKKLL
jgi:hypothetical protein